MLLGFLYKNIMQYLSEVFKNQHKNYATHFLQNSIYGRLRILCRPTNLF